METFFATCAKGLEPLLHEELLALKAVRIERQVGGVRFDGDLTLAWRANLELFTATRVLWRLARFAAANADELYQGVQAIDWQRFLKAEATLAVRATTTASQLEHTQFITQRVKDAIVDQLRDKTGQRPTVDKDDADLWLHVHVARDVASLHLDTSGEALYKRGWRKFQGRAPLAETLAAGMLRYSSWDHRAPIVDSFCGSGTILIEAALLAGGFAPGRYGRAYAFERIPGHDAAGYAKFAAPIRARGKLRSKQRLVGLDRDSTAVQGALENAAAAGFEDKIVIESARAEDWTVVKGWNAWLVSNLPYGERVGDRRELDQLLRVWNERVLSKASGYHAALLLPHELRGRLEALDDARSIPLSNGGIECELVLGALQ